MQLSDFDYHLPDELIARYPGETRTGSRLLCLDRHSGAISHCIFHDVLQLIQPGDLLVFNDTRVIPARLFGHKASGGRIEVMMERMLADNEAVAQIRASKSPAAGTLLKLVSPDSSETMDAEVLGRQGEFYQLRFLSDEPLIKLLDRFGHMPLPPYIDRADEQSDLARYQTVYGRNPGAVAAPTAGLHFDDELLNALKVKGVDQAFLTLHVGSGTFQPVRTDNVLEHKMHSEWIDVPATVVEQVKACKARGGKVIAVGTTSVRSLESAALKAKQQGSSELQACCGETDIFIYPGYEFSVVDAMITNFHLPRSTLMMLISAFSCRDSVMMAYEEAIRERYRFFSYGDAMFIS
ncbi:MAG: tRNA preQ1(34) S-adenosylmethionine ribosyltransferase-isomerase QueA [Pseudohongiella sp.]|nr:tRNA preQ1(34) S-adenosylmethionine ribosyltransferase-isomerase QueA [Pseudohongiella sp.]MDO9519976.1 tRNA preQ1(34) S-adenosylmethionine ribosyltransferase-isomerase QueA [Pseudohongiella sp.]